MIRRQGSTPANAFAPDSRKAEQQWKIRRNRAKPDNEIVPSLSFHIKMEILPAL
jgi:hypothetical protein